MYKGLSPRLAYQDGYRKAVAWKSTAIGGTWIFAEVYTETCELVFKYDTGKHDLIVRKKFSESKDLWEAFLDLKPTDITETILHALRTASKPQENPS